MESPIFENIQIDVEQLPKVESLTFYPLKKVYLYASLTSALSTVLVLLGLALFLSVQFPFIEKKAYIIMGVIGVLGLLTVVGILVGFKYKGYAVRNRDISYRTGLIFRKTTTLAFNRVQHSETSQGPIDRLFDLSKLKIYTAGGSGSDLEIPGLGKDTAEYLKRLITDKTILDEEK